MEIRLNIKGVVRQFVAPHRRQSNRLAWLYALTDLQGVYDSFVAWCADFRYRVHVTSQHASLQGHLTNVFGPGILIKSFDDQFIGIGLTSEASHWVMFDPMQSIALEGEAAQRFSDADFIVYAPASVNRNLLMAEIERYKLADKAYKIVTK